MNRRSMESPILPGGTLGVFGSGQLGRMFAIAARRLGYRVHVYSPDRQTPTGQVADLEISAAYDDQDAVVEFANKVDVVTYEFENVPHQTIQLVEDRIGVRPHGDALSVTQHRIREKEFLVSKGIPVTPFKKIDSQADLEGLVDQDFPAIMKTATSGYDGKGQTRVEQLAEVAAAWDRLGNHEVILERLVDFVDELSVVGVRGAGLNRTEPNFLTYGPLLNRHKNHILDVTISGAEFPLNVQENAIEITRTIMEELDVVGVICIEFFLTTEGTLLVNELAPRPHNSGHLTIDANVTCQFEQQVRTICGLPLGSTERFQPAAMANLLGEVWESGEPCWPNALKDGGVKLHLYGKQEARPGRKMGHLTALAESADLAVERVLRARDALSHK